MYTYILTNFTNKVLYIGVTSNLKKRVWEHKQKLVKGFTEKYNVSKLVYFEELPDPLTAIERGKTLKNLLRSKKITLVESQNPGWKDLYEEI